MATSQRVHMGMVSLHCLLCGHQTAEVRLPTAALDRLTLRKALAEADLETQPRWDALGLPLCPRCSGRLLLDIQPLHAWSNDVPAKGAREREIDLVK